MKMIKLTLWKQFHTSDDVFHPDDIWNKDHTRLIKSAVYINTDYIYALEEFEKERQLVRKISNGKSIESEIQYVRRSMTAVSLNIGYAAPVCEVLESVEEVLKLIKEGVPSLNLKK